MKLLTEMTKQATRLAAALRRARPVRRSPWRLASTSSAIAVKGDRGEDRPGPEELPRPVRGDRRLARTATSSVSASSLIGLASDLNDLNKISVRLSRPRRTHPTVEAYHHLITT
ncbi:hypothetical protein LV779_36885 [Streptomyces thinghirensis]|nr:hypothetical protein [Streptomyces thinghirensis]